MTEYRIITRKDGSAVLTRGMWNPKCKEESIKLSSGDVIPKLWLYEKGQKVVNRDGDIALITSIRPSLSNNIARFMIVTDKGEFWASMLVGEFIREIEEYQLKAFLNDE